MPSFLDWAGQEIPYRIIDAQPDSDHNYVCEIDPHGVDEWTGFGRGISKQAAIKSAAENWNVFDKSA